MSMLRFAIFTLLFQSGVVAHSPSPQAAATDPEARHALVAAIAANLKQLYVDRAVGQQLADALLAHDRNGDYDSFAIEATLAARINTDIQATSRALRIPLAGVFVADVVYSERPLPTGPPPPMTDEMRARHRTTLLEQNCLFEIVETLAQNVGNVKLNGFPEATACQETTGRVMASLNNTGALIVDLRDNGGGFGESALQIAGYRFDRPTFMFDPWLNSPVPARTASPISGNTLVDKSVYVLTSTTTQSAAEYFVYNLKMLSGQPSSAWRQPPAISTRARFIASTITSASASRKRRCPTIRIP